MKFKHLFFWIPIAFVMLITYDWLAFFMEWPSLGLGFMESSFIGLLWFFVILVLVWFVMKGIFPDLHDTMEIELKKGTRCDYLTPKERVEWGLRVFLVLLAVLAYLVKPTT